MHPRRRRRNSETAVSLRQAAARAVRRRLPIVGYPRGRVGSRGMGPPFGTTLCYLYFGGLGDLRKFHGSMAFPCLVISPSFVCLPVSGWEALIGD